MTEQEPPEILNIEQAAELLGVSVKTFNKVLHSQDLPARKIGREWKFSRAALIHWVGSGRSSKFYRENAEEEDASPESGATQEVARGSGRTSAGRSRRTAGWNIEY